MCSYGYTAFFLKKFFCVEIEQAELKMSNKLQYYNTNQKSYKNR